MSNDAEEQSVDQSQDTEVAQESDTPQQEELSEFDQFEADLDDVVVEEPASDEIEVEPQPAPTEEPVASESSEQQEQESEPDQPATYDVNGKTYTLEELAKQGLLTQVLADAKTHREQNKHFQAKYRELKEQTAAQQPPAPPDGATPPPQQQQQHHMLTGEQLKQAREIAKARGQQVQQQLKPLAGVVAEEDFLEDYPILAANLHSEIGNGRAMAERLAKVEKFISAFGEQYDRMESQQAVDGLFTTLANEIPALAHAGHRNAFQDWVVEQPSFSSVPLDVLQQDNKFLRAAYEMWIRTDGAAAPKPPPAAVRAPGGAAQLAGSDPTGGAPPPTPAPSQFEALVNLLEE